MCVCVCVCVCVSGISLYNCVHVCLYQLRQLEEEVEEYERLTRELKSSCIEKDKRIQVRKARVPI